MGLSKKADPGVRKSRLHNLDEAIEAANFNHDRYLIPSLVRHRAELEDWTRSTDQTRRAMKYARIAALLDEERSTLGVEIDKAAIAELDKEAYDAMMYAGIYEDFSESDPEIARMNRQITASQKDNQRAIEDSLTYLKRKNTHSLDDLYSSLQSMKCKDAQDVFVGVCCDKISEFITNMMLLKQIVKSQLIKNDFKIPALCDKLIKEVSDAFMKMEQQMPDYYDLRPEDPREILKQCGEKGELPVIALLSLPAERLEENEALIASFDDVDDDAGYEEGDGDDILTDNSLGPLL